MEEVEVHAVGHEVDVAVEPLAALAEAFGRDDGGLGHREVLRFQRGAVLADPRRGGDLVVSVVDPPALAQPARQREAELRRERRHHHGRLHRELAHRVADRGPDDLAVDAERGAEGRALVHPARGEHRR
ncbi:MAG TPA: hypothetical protein EYQ24_03335 [Bacteroidetes bacterium]|nr:hypothetical protein [Bacteroidota bacterium]